VYGGMGNGTTVRAYVEVCNSGVWTFELGTGEAEAEIGESGSIPATQLETVVLVLDRRRKMVRTVAFGVGGG